MRLSEVRSALRSERWWDGSLGRVSRPVQARSRRRNPIRNHPAEALSFPQIDAVPDGRLTALESAFRWSLKAKCQASTSPLNQNAQTGRFFRATRDSLIRVATVAHLPRAVRTPRQRFGRSLFHQIENGGWAGSAETLRWHTPQVAHQVFLGLAVLGRRSTRFPSVRSVYRRANRPTPAPARTEALSPAR